MTTEEEARDLLARAALTIEIDEAVPPALTDLAEPGRRRWPALAAAAAVVVAVGGGYAVAQQLAGQDGPAPAPADRTPSVTDGASAPPRDDALPSLLGYTEDEAIRLLQERGHPVSVRVVPDGCDVAGIVTGTNPPTGTPVSPGSPVTIRVVGEQVVIDCVGEVPMRIVWDVVRAAQGIGEPVPTITDAVLEDLGAQLAGASRVHARWVFDGSPCDEGADPAWDLRIWTTAAADAAGCPATSFLVAFDGTAVTAVATDAHDAAVAPTLSNAREEAAERFVAWARGEGSAPDFADRVRLVGGGFHPAFVDEPEDRSRYAGCSGLGFPDCGIDPVAAIFRADGPIEATPGTLSNDSALPSRLAAAEGDLVSLGYRGAGEVTPLVDLWIDDGGQIYAITQTDMPPR